MSQRDALTCIREAERSGRFAANCGAQTVCAVSTRNDSRKSTHTDRYTRFFDRLCSITYGVDFTVGDRAHERVGENLTSFVDGQAYLAVQSRSRECTRP